MDRREYIRSLGSISVGSLIAGCMGSNGNSGGSGNKKITAGAAVGFPPFDVKKDGEVTGFDIEVLRAAVDESEYTISGMKTFDFQSLIPALTKNKVDVIAGALSVTSERKEKIAFTNSYYNVKQAILVREKDEFSPNALEDLVGHQVGSQQGSTGESLIQNELVDGGELKSSNYTGYNTYVLAVQDLVNGNIDALVIDTPVGQTFSDNRPVKIAFSVATGDKYAYGIRKDANNLQSGLNSGLKEIRDNGKHEEIKSNWIGGGVIK